MSQREIVVWVDERWCKALEKHLLDGTVAEKLEEHIDELVNKLPENVYERISSEIWQEREQAKMEAEAARRFAVLHVTEDGNSTYFVAEENLDMLHVAARLRSYTRKPPENSPVRFTGMFSKGEKISREQFDAYVQERLYTPGRVTGAFNIDLDKGRFNTLHIIDGWQSFRLKDVSSAAYFADKSGHVNKEVRWNIFLSRLEGKQLTSHTQAPVELHGSRRLRPEEIIFKASEKEARYLEDLPLHHSQKVIAKDGNSVTFSIFVCPNESLVMELFRLGPRIEVLEPAHIRQEVAETALETARLYKDGK